MSRRVLVVEDDPDIGRLVTLQLAEIGCDCTLIADGVSALAEGKHEPSHLAAAPRPCPAGSC